VQQINSRSEIKYIISERQYQVLINRIEIIVPEDKNSAGSLGYQVRSVYFDSYKDKSLNEKDEGFAARTKYRIRIYDLDCDEVKIEVKNKINERVTKQTQIISKEHAQKLLGGEYDFLINSENPLLQQIYTKFVIGNYRPKLLIEYQRRAFFDEASNVRITFDHNIRINKSNFDLFGKNTHLIKIVPQNLRVLEIKYDRIIPEHIKRALQIDRFEKTSFSKYLTGRKYE
jgi:hypothetical protein